MRGIFRNDFRYLVPSEWMIGFHIYAYNKVCCTTGRENQVEVLTKSFNI